MANLNTNAGLMTFPNGGQILIGSDRVMNIVEGSVRWKQTFKRRIMHYDDGVPQVPIKGIKDYGSIEFNVKMGDHNDSSVFATLMADNSPATGYVKTFSMVIKRFPDTGVTTGESITFSDAFLMSVPEFSGGDGTGNLDTETYSLGFVSDATFGDLT